MIGIPIVNLYVNIGSILHNQKFIKESNQKLNQQIKTSPALQDKTITYDVNDLLQLFKCDLCQGFIVDAVVLQECHCRFCKTCITMHFFYDTGPIYKLLDPEHYEVLRKKNFDFVGSNKRQAKFQRMKLLPEENSSNDKVNYIQKI